MLSLIFEFRTVTVKLRDQAPIAVAKVEGTEAYKDLMSRAGASTTEKVSHYGTWYSLYNLMFPQFLWIIWHNAVEIPTSTRYRVYFAL